MLAIQKLTPAEETNRKLYTQNRSKRWQRIVGDRFAREFRHRFGSASKLFTRPYEVKHLRPRQPEIVSQWSRLLLWAYMLMQVHEHLANGGSSRMF